MPFLTVLLVKLLLWPEWLPVQLPLQLLLLVRWTSNGRVLAPFDATVRQVFTAKHAVGLVGDNGLVLLIHIGLGTVKLKGTGFVSYVEEGQKVKKGQELIEFWDPTIKKAGLDDTVIVVVTNSKDFKDIKLTDTEGSEVKAEDDVMTLEAKEKTEAK